MKNVKAPARVVIALLLAAVLGLPDRPAAQAEVSRPYRGVTYSDRWSDAPRRIHLHIAQIDLKTRGLPWNLVEGAFAMAKKGRAQILDFMKTIIAEPRAELSQYAPRITTVRVSFAHAIRELIARHRDQERCQLPRFMQLEPPGRDFNEEFE